MNVDVADNFNDIYDDDDDDKSVKISWNYKCSISYLYLI